MNILISLHSILRAAYKEDSELSQRNKSASCLTNTIKMLKSILKLDSQNITFPHFSYVLERYYKRKLHLNWNTFTVLSKKISNDHELIQSDPTSCPQNQKGNN